MSALKIAKEESTNGKSIDIELVELAALFHDIGDAKFHKEGQPTGREIVMTFLAKHDYAKADIVAKIVENVSFRKELAGIKNEWAESCIELHMYVVFFFFFRLLVVDELVVVISGCLC